ncbi:uncharacterized protein LOC120681970 [Panicum virgatum]|uniref:SHSP domain-containing protein n=1 Tax=Panicum virgatum TaxID=38727 RepID=A0A8T0PR98_PANVG|nr:uncharacterized protein LOC120681970 [Panicum virgatum]KAG2564513.1 hypothetical protein PVAP13_7NG295789 [Panicum virgatum]
MSMLSSYTFLSLAPAQGKFSPAPLQLRKQPAASSSVVVVPWAPCKVSRAPRLACYSKKNTYDILPTALVHPSVGDHGNWKMAEDKDHITLDFNVGRETEVSELEVATTRDQALLVIRYKGDSSDVNNPAASLDVRLLMPPGYDGNKVMKAEILSDGWLKIIIAKPKQEPTTIKVTKQIIDKSN